MTPIDDSLTRFEGKQLATLQAMVTMVRDLLPSATEEISYGMPAFKIAGVGVLGLEGFKRHNSLFPMSGGVPARLARELEGYQVSKGTIQFAIDKPMPKALVRAIIQARIAEINEGYPRKNGEVKEFYSNGVLKAEGKMRGDELHGAWRWYRKDGSLMRTGSFTDGTQAGEWVTYDSTGRVVKRTQFTPKSGAQ